MFAHQVFAKQLARDFNGRLLIKGTRKFQDRTG